MRLCMAFECNRKNYALGWCRMHYQQNTKANCHPRLPYKSEKYGPTCTIDGCNEPHRTRGLCNMHYGRLRTRGDAKWQSSRREYGSGKKWHANPDGYIVRYEPDNPNAGPNGQVYQHRHVMSKKMGRPLLGHESVHHRNGNRSDNRPENLELWSSSQPAGQNVKDKVAWAREIISLYGDM